MRTYSVGAYTFNDKFSPLSSLYNFDRTETKTVLYKFQFVSVVRISTRRLHIYIYCSQFLAYVSGCFIRENKVRLSCEVFFYIFSRVIII